ncbi:uncharacterized protein LOC132943980 [Metopolophium dirhodum]|uniref:uncharacterized protein LOC132943980 n=1 Tax=Metopolophium dirhodum TaxID=44670 RepID=UPI0029902107|nr:uncharacterized protein LOC132943980 [Metopolophium dirhodum]XP_060869157.1 uncharacterized protein LOC132943980 [Metopolophium dirhodum]XP_060869158.1 uncharacterized protein LOC132943980 [Metopolophium dirhodum]
MEMDEDSCFFGDGGTLATFHRKSRCLRFWLYSGAFPHGRSSSHTSRIPPKESIIKTELLDRRYEDARSKGPRFAGRINNYKWYSSVNIFKLGIIYHKQIEMCERFSVSKTKFRSRFRFRHGSTNNTFWIN